MTAKKCVECGHKIENNEKTCPNCGIRIYNSGKPNKNKKKIIIITSIIVGLIVVIGTIFLILFILKKVDNSEKNKFIDDAINIAKAAETAYVADALNSEEKLKYTIDDLEDKYLDNTKYSGCVVLDVDGDNITKRIYITDGKYMIVNKNLMSYDFDEDSVKEYDSYGKNGWKYKYEFCDIGDEETTIEESNEKIEQETLEEQETTKNEETKTNTKNNASVQKENNTNKQSVTDSNNSIKQNDSSNEISVSKKNATKSAQSYLRYSNFSRKGLIEQLEYEKFTNEDATYAVDSLNVNWNEQALGSAKSYLRTSAFSKKRLVEQLKYEGFTTDQANYGVENCGANWMEQAVKSARSYLNSSSFSRDGLIDQLLYEGFTREQATYGVEQNGL